MSFMQWLKAGSCMARKATPPALQPSSGTLDYGISEVEMDHTDHWVTFPAPCRMIPRGAFQPEIFYDHLRLNHMTKHHPDAPWMLTGLEIILLVTCSVTNHPLNKEPLPHVQSELFPDAVSFHLLMSDLWLPERRSCLLLHFLSWGSCRLL